MDCTIHKIKLDKRFYSLVKDRIKAFEIRYDDRLYQAGDYLVLRREPPLPEPLSEDPIIKRIKYKLTEHEMDGLAKGYCALGLQDVTLDEGAAILEIARLREQLEGAGWVH